MCDGFIATTAAVVVTTAVAAAVVAGAAITGVNILLRMQIVPLTAMCWIII